MVLTKEKLQAQLLNLQLQGAQVAGAIQLLQAQIADVDKPEPTRAPQPAPATPEPAVSAEQK